MYSDVTYDSIMLFVLLYAISTALVELLVCAYTICVIWDVVNTRRRTKSVCIAYLFALNRV